MDENMYSIEVRKIEKIPSTPREREGEDFNVELTDEELTSLKDLADKIRYEKVVQFLLPIFDGEAYFEWIAARISSYMTHIIRKQEYIP
jgi:hypothetical protein